MPELAPTPFKEAVEFFRKRIVMPPGEFNTLAREVGDSAKARAFTISGIARTDVLTDVFNALDKAVADGETFGDFRDRIDDIMDRRGWEGLTPYRLDNIFRTNVQMSYMTGRHEQMKKIANRRPYWQYSAVNDSRTRPSHRAMDGKVFLHDHPFWQEWYPPNGYRCRCSVTSLSQKELDAEGLTAEKAPPKNPTTGRAYEPDDGWAFSPARSWKGIVNPIAKNLNAPASAVLAGTAERLALFDLKPVKEMDWEAFPKAVELPGKEALRRQGVDPIPYYKQELRKRLNMTGESVVLLSPDNAAAVFDSLVFKHVDWENRGRYVPMVRETYDTPDEIWINAVELKSGGTALRKYHLKYYRSEKKPLGIVVVLDFERGVWRSLTVIPRERLKRIDDIRAGVCVYNK